MLSGFEKMSADVAERKAEFTRLTDVLVGFCRENGLYAEKFYHGLPEWHLRFARKAGGRAFIAVVAVREKHDVVFRVRGIWYFDDVQTRKRYTRTLRPDLLYVPTEPPGKLKEALAEALRGMDAWVPGGWDTVLDLPGGWRGQTQDQVSGSSEFYPLRS